jgi:hypothetical protein
MGIRRGKMAFNPAGPFIAVKGKVVYAEPLQVGTAYGKEYFDALGERRTEALFGAGWLEMAPADYDGPVITAEGQVMSDPLDLDNDGSKGGSLTNLEEAALRQAGHDLPEWYKLSKAKRAKTLAEAVEAYDPAAAAPETGAGGGSGESGGDNGQTGGEGAVEPENGSGAEAGAATAQGGAATVPAESDTTVVAYKHFGFGKWFPINAAGDKVGDKVSKSAAEGLAAQAGVPLRGMME